MKSGVARAKRGRGRPKGAIYPHKSTLALTDEQLDKLEALSERYGLSVSALIRECIDSDLPRLTQRLIKRAKRRGSAV